MCAFEFSTSVRFGSLWTHDMEVMKTEHVSIEFDSLRSPVLEAGTCDQHCWTAG
jgi:hypothetical protein